MQYQLVVNVWVVFYKDTYLGTYRTWKGAQRFAPTRATKLGLR